MKNTKLYYMLGGVLCLIAAVFAAAALRHPEFAFPWPNWVSYTMYALYGSYTILVLCMPKFRGVSLAACGILAVQFIALALLALSIGSRNTPNDNNWYLTAALGLTCGANFANLVLQKKHKKEK